MFHRQAHKRSDIGHDELITRCIAHRVFARRAVKHQQGRALALRLRLLLIVTRCGNTQMLRGAVSSAAQRAATCG